MGEVPQRHEVGDHQDDPDLGVLHGGNHPDHGGDHPARDDALGKHLVQIVLHHLATDIEKGFVGLAVEDWQVQHHVGNQYGAGEVAEQHHGP
ncbi:hypothetical protein D3C77_351820 [compost metagenome]